MSIKETKDIRCLNRLHILNTIIKFKNISRADIATLTGLNKATVSTIVKELIDLGLIEESTIGESTGGRKPIILSLKSHEGYSIAIDLNVSSITVIVTNLMLSVCSTHTFPVYVEHIALTFNTLCKGIESIISTLPSTPFGLIGISVAVRGVVDLDHMIRFIPSLDWHNINLKEMLEARFNVPIFIDNDGNLSAIAESSYLPQAKEVVVINIDDTITSGLISNGHIIRGFLGFANSIGHHVIDMHYPHPCVCGKNGCWEQFCSFPSFLDYANTLFKVDSIEDFIESVEAEHPKALEALDYFIHHLSVGISNMIFILNCEHIIINSLLFTRLPYLLHEIHQRLTLPITNYQDISISKLGKMSPLLGAVSICTQAFFKDTLDF